MKAGIFILALCSLLLSAFAYPTYNKREIPAKRELVTKYVIVEIPEIVVWVDKAGNTVSIETRGKVVTRTDTVCPSGVTTLGGPAPSTPPGAGFIGVVSPGDEERAPPTAPAPEPAPKPAPKPAPAPQPSYPPAPPPPKAEPAPPAPPPPPPPAYVPVPEPKPKPEVAPPAPIPESKPVVVPPPPPPPPPPAQPYVPPPKPVDGPGPAGSGLGVTYTPYNGDGTCKSEGQVVADFGKLNGFGFVRSYGVDCNQIQHLIKAAKVHNKKLFLGVFDIDQLNNDLQTLIKGVGGSWDRVTAIAIGNELVNSGKRPAGAVVNAINTARGVLRGAGYQGPVVTVDTFVAIIANPQLCHASDFCAANCHAFFDGNVSPSGAGDFVKSQAERVSAAVGGKRTIITESGWPHQGSTNGKATPSDQNQQQAIASLKAKFAGTDGGIYLFSAFDDAWKKDNQYTFGTERYWGVM